MIIYKRLPVWNCKALRKDGVLTDSACSVWDRAQLLSAPVGASLCAAWAPGETGSGRLCARLAGNVGTMWEGSMGGKGRVTMNVLGLGTSNMAYDLVSCTAIEFVVCVYTGYIMQLYKAHNVVLVYKSIM